MIQSSINVFEWRMIHVNRENMSCLNKSASKKTTGLESEYLNINQLIFISYKYLEMNLKVTASFIVLLDKTST